VPKSLCFMDPSSERCRVAGLRLQFHCNIKIALRRMRSRNATSKNIRLGYKTLERSPAGYCLREVVEVHGPIAKCFLFLSTGESIAKRLCHQLMSRLPPVGRMFVEVLGNDCC